MHKEASIRTVCSTSECRGYFQINFHDTRSTDNLGFHFEAASRLHRQERVEWSHRN